MKTSLLLVSSIVLLLSGQNCSRFSELSDFTSSLASGSTNMASGNGAGYDGKISYYRFVPGSRCAGDLQALARIDTAQQSGILDFQQFQNSTCASEQVTLQPTDVDYSGITDAILGYGKNIYENPVTQKLNAPQSLPDKLTEVWCFDDIKAKSIELVLQFDRSSKQTTATYRNGSKITSFEGLSRLVGATKLQYKTTPLPVGNPPTNGQVSTTSTGSFSFSLARKDLSDVPPSLVLGNLELTLNNGDLVANRLSCRLGGYLDENLWPSKNLGSPSSESLFSRDNRFLYQISEDASSAYVVSTDGASVTVTPRYIQRIDLNPELRTDTELSVPLVVPAKNHRGVTHFKFSQDEKYIVFIADLDEDAPGAVNLYSLELSNSMIKKLSPGIKSPAQSVTDFRTTRDGVLYLDGSQEPKESADVENWLRFSKLDGSEIGTLVSDPLPISGDYDVMFLDFGDGVHDLPVNKMQVAKTSSLYDETWFLQAQNRSHLRFDIWAYNARSHTKRRVFESSDTSIFWRGSFVYLVNDENSFIARLWDTNPTNQGFRNFQIQNGYPVKINEDSSFILRQGFKNSFVAQKISILPNASTWLWIASGPGQHLIDLTFYDQFFQAWLTTDVYSHPGHDMYLFTPKGDAVILIDGNKRLGQVREGIPFVQPLCEGLDRFENLTIGPSEDFFAIRSTEVRDEVWRLSATTNYTTCTLVNSSPKTSSLSGMLIVSPDEKSILLNVGRTTMANALNNTESHIVWLPLDGRAPTQIDTSEESTQIVGSVADHRGFYGLTLYNSLGFFDNTGKYIYFFTGQTSFAEISQLHRWSRPE